MNAKLKALLDAPFPEGDYATFDYDVNLTGATPVDLLKLIAKYEEDENALGGAAFDIVRNLKPWLEERIITCKWKECGDGSLCESEEHEHVMLATSELKSERFKFCPYCGKLVTVEAQGL